MRFDLNDYSIPTPMCGAASPCWPVRTGFAFWTVAPFWPEHARSYDKGAQVEMQPTSKP
ncbi:MAG: hypothetical protein IPF55_15875 [Rhodoferax sp.]|nr:hypothetical protein [Rhodoferax sp.]